MNLHLRSSWATLMDDSEDVLAERYLREGEKLCTGGEAEITDFLVYIRIQIPHPSHRRLTLAPGELIDLMSMPSSPVKCFDSRFSELDGDDEAESLATGVVSEVLEEARETTREVLCREPISPKQLEREFWVFVGYPT